MSIDMTFCSETREWSRERTAFLIALFKGKRELWDPTFLGYKDRAQKHNAWAELGMRVGLEAHEVEKKLRILMGQFFRELKKGRIEDSTDSPYKSKWFFFEMLLFLKDKKALRDVTFQHVAHDQEITQSEDNSLESASNSFTGSDHEVEEQKFFAHTYMHGSIPQHIPTVSKCVKRKADTSADEVFAVMKSISSNLKTRDEFDVFGEYVAYSLRNLKTISSQSHAKFQISNVLYQTEMEFQQDD